VRHSNPEDQSLWRMTKRVMRLPAPSPLVTPGGIALSDSEKAEVLAESVETQFQPATDPSVSAVVKIVDVSLRSYFLTPAREPKITNPDEVHEAIRGLKVSKAPGPNGIPNRAMKHLPPPRPDFECGSPHPSLLYSVEAGSGDLYPYTGEASSTALVLSVYYYLGQDL